MASEILGLFTTPEQYQQSQRQAQEAQAIQYANLSPRAKADYGFYSAGQQLAGAIGGALGGQDPQLQRITQRQQLLGMIDPNNPDSYAQAIQAALQGGDQEAAFLLRNEMMKVKEQAQQQEIRGFEREKFLLDRGLGIKQRSMEARALSIASGIDPDTGLKGKSILNEQGEVVDTQALKPLFDPTTQKFNQDVANTLISEYGQIGANIVNQRLQGVQGVESLQTQELARQLFNEDGSRNPEIEKKLSVTVKGREILKQFAPETKELKKGEKLLERQPDGTWRLITPEGQPVQSTSSDNAIQSLITGKAIHPTVLPYAQQLARSFPNLDTEDQDKAVEKLTTINNTALNRETDKSAKAMVQASSLATQALTRQMIELNINKAKDAALKAADGKEIKLADSTKLADKASSVEKLTDLSTSFKSSFAGYPTDAAGNLAVLVASKLSDPDSVDLFQWWQTYQEHVNKVRNDLFGAALTAPEKAEFDKAMVTKGMSPQQAKANLDRQAEIATRAYNKLDNVLRVQGYSKAGLDALKPSASLPPLESFLIETPNTNPKNITGGRR